MNEATEHIYLKMLTNQSEQIRLQKEAIDELFGLLASYMAADEMDRLPCVEKINTVAMLRREME